MSMTYHGLTFRGTPKQPGRDNHAHTVEQDGAAYLGCTFDANGASEAFKSSRRWDITVEGGEVHGGVEDAIDVVRGGNLLFKRVAVFRGPGRQCATIKGGVRGLLFEMCPGLRLIVAGDYTKYDAMAIYPDGTVRKARPWCLARPPVRRCGAWTASGKITVINLHSEPWRGDVRNIRIPWAPLHRFVVATYFWARATFFKEQLQPDREQFKLDQREL